MPQHTPETAIIKRSAARLAAVQALYSLEADPSDVPIAQRIVDFIALYDPEYAVLSSEAEDSEQGATVEMDSSYFAALVEGVTTEQERLDAVIVNYLSDKWRMERLDMTLKAILRAGAYELLKRDKVPTKVVINEYINVAKAFFDGDEPKFINAVLDRMAQQLREMP